MAESWLPPSWDERDKEEMNSFFRQPAGSEFPKGWEALPPSWGTEKLTWGNNEQDQL